MLASTVRVFCVVPSRIGSTRLPQKPLCRIAGDPLILHVVRRVLDFDVGPVLVATDDVRVAEAVAGSGARVALTDPACRSGTERVAAAVAAEELADADVVLSVQGDEPLIPYAAVVGAVERVRGGDEIGTAAGLLGPGDWRDPNRVKVTVDGRGRGRAFFRIPPLDAALGRDTVYHHVGVYAYRREALLRWVGLPPIREEQDQRLEQLRPLVHGMTIGVAVLEAPVPGGVDTEADLLEAERQLETARR